MVAARTIILCAQTTCDSSCVLCLARLSITCIPIILKHNYKACFVNLILNDHSCKILYCVEKQMIYPMNHLNQPFYTKRKVHTIYIEWYIIYK